MGDVSGKRRGSGKKSETGRQADGKTTSAGLPEVEQRLFGQVDRWREKLLDLGNRNPLINCSLSPTRGAVELLHPEAETIWQSLAAESAAGTDSMRFPWRKLLVPPPRGFKDETLGSDPVEGEPKNKEWNPPLEECISSWQLRDMDILTGLGDRAIDRRLRTLNSHSQLSLSEQGVHCLYLAFGFLKWFENADSEQELRSPLMLVPVSLSRSSADAPWELTEAEDDAIDNLCLRQRLKQDFGLELPPLPDIDNLEEEGAREEYLDAIRLAIADNPRWEVEDRCALGRFAFPKVAMWQDLGEHAAGVLANPLCRSIAGDQNVPPQQAFGSTEKLPDAARLDDEVPPGEVKTILDCDSSQLEAIVAARRGVSFVLDGPPGTGKSQTIANIIADALSDGRTVLFVSEKVSALEVVKRRLDDCGLGDFCLECHSSKANRKAVLEELKWCLELPAEVYDDATPKLEEAKRHRAALNDYVRAIHRPREPLGLSPYELYGQVARLNRLGLSTKSRCELPDPAGVDRATFDGWLHLFERANEVADVIKGEAAHPWRACRLLSRPLSLSDDLHHHLGVLSDAFGEVASATEPLIREGLITDEPSPGTLNELMRTLKDALSSPEIPASWFGAPDEIAKAVLRRCDSETAVQQSREALREFVDDIDARMPEALDLEHTSSPGGWLERLKYRLPSGVRAQHDLLASYLGHLTSALEHCAATETQIQKLVEQITIPIRLDFSVKTIPRLVQLARTISDGVPFRPGWLNPDHWTRLRQACNDSLSELTEARAAAVRLEGRVSPERLGGLARSIESLPTVEASWAVLRPLLHEGSPAEVATLVESATAASRALSDTAAAMGELAQILGIEGDFRVTLHLSRIVWSEIPQLLEHGVVHGAWQDAGGRTKLLRACDAVFEDLQEAARLREQLESRLSHRAFQPEAAGLAERSLPFGSVWKRLFGGFSVFRREVADLFKGPLPTVKPLLADLGHLRLYHRRTQDSVAAAVTLAELLPAPHDAESSQAWKRISLAVKAFERLAASLPDVASILPRRSIPLDRSVCEPLLARIEASLGRIQTAVAGTSLSSFLSESAELNSIAARLTEIATAGSTCLEAWTSTTVFYDRPPTGFQQMLADARHALQYANLLEQAAHRFDRFLDLMPLGATSAEPSSWERTLAGIEAADRLRTLTRSPEKLREALCDQGRIDSVAVREAADAVDASYEQLIVVVERIEAFLTLSRPDKPVMETSQHSLSDLTSVLSEARAAFQSRIDELHQLLPLLLPTADIRIDDIPGKLATIRSLQSSIRILAEANQFLRSKDVGPADIPPGGGRTEAEWIQERIASRSLDALIEATASNADSRQLVTSAVDHLQQACGGDFRQSWGWLKDAFDLDVETSTGLSLVNMPAGQLCRHLESLRREIDSLDDWLKFSRWRRDMTDSGFDSVVEELLRGRYEPSETSDVIAARFYRRVFDHLAAEDRILGEFDLESHEQLRQQFRRLDEWEVKAATTRIRQFQLGRDDRPRGGWSAPVTSELGIVQRETQKKRRLMPLRRLFAEIPGVLQRLKPCIMMSPLSVSTFLHSDEIRFDLVIFDEASQVFPWDAIGAIYRGKQLIVAGDEKQLPPTNFFNRGDLESDEEDEEDDLGDFESILKLCKSIGMPGKRLRWHYRSHREPLIAFSNRHFYGGDLVTFPSVRDAEGDAVRLELVPDGRWVNRSNRAEAERVTDLVIAHLRSRPETSIGVIAFNASQQAAIEDAIYERRRKRPEIDALFDIGLVEPLFVKNLENVQGDERDVILLSMGYGYNDSNKFIKNFGPLTKAGGERRLNVAVTRARDEVVLVASVRASDMDLSASKSEGAHLLKGYLEYAERGVDTLGRVVESLAGESESRFEAEVAAALSRRGLTPVPQVGCGGFRIDLALKHPDRPGEFCLGIECDGATYHSSKTARDRDRIRQSVLESLGWRIVRVWSTDWVRNPERQLESIIAAYEMAGAAGRSEAPFPADEESDDGIVDGLTPHLVAASAPAGKKYSKIDEVPDGQIRASALVVAIRVGATDLEDFIRLVARELGFERTGKKIRERLEAILQEEVHAGKLRRIGERVGPPTHPA